MSMVAGSLAIVIPYRDRRAHLEEFLPAFAEHAVRWPTKIPEKTSIKIIEQTEGRAFNRGKIKNVGYQLTKEEAEYVCFHDVDYCPLRADYSVPAEGFWAHLASHQIRTAVDPRGLNKANKGDDFIGGVVLFAKQDFERINGYANSYWGWGFEDLDLFARTKMIGLALDRRHGRFRLLPHINEGHELAADGSFVDSAASIENKALALSRFPALDKNLTNDERVALSAIERDGLSNLDFAIVSRDRLPDAGRFSVEIITVAI